MAIKRVNPIILRNLCKRILSSDIKYMYDTTLVYFKLVEDKVIQDDPVNRANVNKICNSCISDMGMGLGVGRVTL